LRHELDHIQDEFNQTISKLEEFKTLIQYKERKTKVKRDENKEFSQTLGSNFYERQLNA
jgi:hypothetical protein